MCKTDILMEKTDFYMKKTDSLMEKTDFYMEKTHGFMDITHGFMAFSLSLKKKTLTLKKKTPFRMEVLQCFGEIKYFLGEKFFGGDDKSATISVPPVLPVAIHVQPLRGFPF